MPQLRPVTTHVATCGRWLVLFRSSEMLEAPGKEPGRQGAFEIVFRWNEGLVADASFTQQETAALEQLAQHVAQLLGAHQGDWPAVFTKQEVDGLLQRLSQTHSSFGGGAADVLPIDADIPRPFTAINCCAALKPTPS